ncbi:hypothetical protein F441_05972 [Phytophthora nicotianae CJ01A1]|uniref:Uncharacterized protein n=5 Tax=Phytophthora nicotianae TaxID=4792 RepID=V9FHE3_PHYNI|nr:hypothetical protein F443_05968 [Phytophthora nicotianae P1569]ETL96972.1 hypothetical protein L917_05667 [Phytophthora nicotianae]ETO79256.1 hypothetical protein F444_06013 [Phytophthora nicotianae P1976]ETP20286.1 hypothetical protein F441_05972 [Phytophthora nicotianae CJ01A1]ETP51830.1 hypothetical protein F442_03081 [Phytophthora nicotianae P10297]
MARLNQSRRQYDPTTRNGNRERQRQVEPPSCAAASGSGITQLLPAQDQGNRRYGTGVRRRDHERQQLGQDQGHPDVSESGATRAHPRRPRWAKPTALDKPAQSSEAPSNGELSNQTMRTDASPVSRMSGRRRLGSRGAGISGRERGNRKPQ